MLSDHFWKYIHDHFIWKHSCESIRTSYLQSDNFMTNRSSWALHFTLGKENPLYPDFYILGLGFPHSSCHLLPGLYFFVCLLVLETQALPHSINLTQFHLGYFLWNYSNGKTAAVVSNKHGNRTEEMSRDYLIHTNTEAGFKHSPMKQMPDCPNPENTQESRFQNICMQPLLVFHPQNPSSWGKVFLSTPTLALTVNNCSLDAIQSVRIFS